MGKMAWGCGRLSVLVFLGFFKSYCFKEKIPFVCLALWNVGMLRLRLSCRLGGQYGSFKGVCFELKVSYFDFE